MLRGLKNGGALLALSERLSARLQSYLQLYSQTGKISYVCCNAVLSATVNAQISAHLQRQRHFYIGFYAFILYTHHYIDSTPQKRDAHCYTVSVRVTSVSVSGHFTCINSFKRRLTRINLLFTAIMVSLFGLLFILCFAFALL